MDMTTIIFADLDIIAFTSVFVYVRMKITNIVTISVLSRLLRGCQIKISDFGYSSDLR